MVHHALNLLPDLAGICDVKAHPNREKHREKTGMNGPIISNNDISRVKRYWVISMRR